MKDKTNHIVEKATALFMQNGFHSVSMDEIALHTGISKKTLYVNFQSKEILVNTIVQHLISRISKYIRICADISPNAIIEMKNFFSFLLDLAETLTPAFMRELKKYYPDAYIQLRVFRNNSIMPFIQHCLQRGIEEDLFRPDIDKSTVGWLYGWQLQTVLEYETYPPDIKRVISDINDLFLHSVLNAKGLKLITMSNENKNAGLKVKPVTD